MTQLHLRVAGKLAYKSIQEIVFGFLRHTAIY